jgi:hypothetical protein
MTSVIIKQREYSDRHQLVEIIPIRKQAEDEHAASNVLPYLIILG